jgi:hypothetical protein
MKLSRGVFPRYHICLIPKEEATLSCLRLTQGYFQLVKLGLAEVTLSKANGHIDNYLGSKD